MDLTYVELFAGAGGMSLGLEMAGWRCVAHAEIEPHAQAVLRYHWPDVPLYGDVSQLGGRQFKGVTMLTGGSPCQDLSIAGKRAGMADGTRSSLFFEQVRIWNEMEAPFILWENVYGAFSSNDGRDFATVLSAIVGGAVAVPADGWRGAGVASGPAGVAAWRTLDAQYFGVPQRRRRVFVLGSRDTRVDPAQVLSLLEGVSGHSTPRRETGKDATGDAGRRLADTGIVPFVYEWHGFDGRAKELTVARTLNIRNQEGREHHVVISVDMYNQSVDANGVRHTVRRGGDGVPHAIVLRNREGKPGGGKGPLLSAERQRTLGTGNDQVLFAGVPRRLTPMECERLMGWPDLHTAIGVNEKGKVYELADTARYKLCGNGIASPVTAWIGFQLRAAVESL